MYREEKSIVMLKKSVIFFLMIAITTPSITGWTDFTPPSFLKEKEVFDTPKEKKPYKNHLFLKKYSIPTEEEKKKVTDISLLLIKGCNHFEKNGNYYAQKQLLDLLTQKMDPITVFDLKSSIKQLAESKIQKKPADYHKEIFKNNDLYEIANFFAEQEVAQSQRPYIDRFKRFFKQHKSNMESILFGVVSTALIVSIPAVWSILTNRAEYCWKGFKGLWKDTSPLAETVHVGWDFNKQKRVPLKIVPDTEANTTPITRAEYLKYSFLYDCGELFSNSTNSLLTSFLSLAFSKSELLTPYIRMFGGSLSKGIIYEGINYFTNNSFIRQVTPEVPTGKPSLSSKTLFLEGMGTAFYRRNSSVFSVKDVIISFISFSVFQFLQENIKDYLSQKENTKIHQYIKKNFPKEYSKLLFSSSKKNTSPYY
jgi:hypothetical protein